MNKSFLKIGLGLLVLAGMVRPSSGAVTMKTLSGHVPAVVSHLATVGSVPSTNTLHLAIGLQVRNQAALDDLVHQVSDPANPMYQHYLTPDEFTAQFGPTEEDYQAVRDFAESHGLAVKKTSSNRMLLEVEGQEADVERAFNVHLHTYNHPTEPRTFFSPDTEPSVPATLPILDITGLNNYGRPHNQLRVRSNATNNPSAIPQLGSGPFGTYMGNDFRAAYVPGAPQTGTGQKVALVQFDGYFASDISTYESLNSLPNVSLTNILLNGFSGFPQTFNGNLEVSLDIEMVVSMAPGVDQVLLYEGDPFNFFPNVVLNQIATDNSAKQIGCSWGWIGGPDATADQIFKQMILQGQSFYHATGDFDAFLPGEVDDPGFFGFPSDDPYITQVGGTTLSTAGPGGAYVSETVWNWDVEFPNQGDDGQGSSGGISSFYRIPSWQTNANMSLNGGSTTFRNTPDVAMVGDNVFVVALGGAEIIGVGGTSVAAPLWAGFTSLINQQAANVGRQPIGFINPSLYALAASPYYNFVFNDVTTGSNTWSLSTNLFVAVTNYDLCTGLGSPRGTNLIYALTSPTNAPLSFSGLIPPPLPPWGSTLSVMNGANPNGLWLLYIQDDTAPTGGTNYNGWSLALTTANPVGTAGDDQLYQNTVINSTQWGNATNVTATLGSMWHTTLAITNYGPSLSSNVFVADSLPAAPGVTLLSSNSTAGSITNFGSTLVWSLGNLPVNAGATLTLNFQVNNTGLFTNSATVNALTLDPNPDDDTVNVIASAGVSTPPMVSPLALSGPGHNFQLSITNDAGATVVIQTSTNLISWLSIYTNVAPFTYTNMSILGDPQRYYRALVSQ